MESQILLCLAHMTPKTTSYPASSKIEMALHLIFLTGIILILIGMYALTQGWNGAFYNPQMPGFVVQLLSTAMLLALFAMFLSPIIAVIAAVSVGLAIYRLVKRKPIKYPWLQMLCTILEVIVIIFALWLLTNMLSSFYT